MSVVPTDRQTVWNPGIYGGVPPDDANASTFPGGVGPATQYGSALSTTGGNDQSLIQTALNNAAAEASKTSRRFVKLNAGTFNVGSNVSVPSYVTLRGTINADGFTRDTKINGTFNGTVVSMGGGSGETWGDVIDCSGAQLKGASTITLATGGGAEFAVGDIINIDQLTDGTGRGPADGDFTRDLATPAATGEFVGYLSSLWYQRQDYDTGDGDGTRGLFPNSPEGFRHIAQICEVLAVNGDVLTIYDPDAEVCGSPLHTVFYNDPQVYRCGGVSDVSRYAGIEDLRVWPQSDPGSGVKAVVIQQSYCCWIKNVEVYGAQNTWVGRLLQIFNQTYRCNVQECYIHESTNYAQGANAYGVVVSGSNNLITNNICVKLNKPIVMECSHGGNVISYNYVDDAVIGSLDYFWQEAAISTHASFCHWDLIEGNYTPNAGMDSTHGNNGWYMIFRNHLTIRNGNGYAGAYERGVFSDGWNYEITSIGNVIGTDGFEFDYIVWEPATGGNPVFGGPESAYLLGSNAWNTSTGAKPGADYEDDGMAYEFFYRHLDYVSGTGGGYYDNPANDVTTLPSSLYLTEAPDFFSGYTWPWVVPSAGSHAARVLTLPAKDRYDDGEA